MRFLRKGVGVFLLLFFSAQAMAITLVYWDFENDVTVGTVSSFAPTSSISSITASASQTGGGPSEVFFGSRVHLTRFFGTQYPFITLTVTEDIHLSGLTFMHYHNHNAGFPTNPNYDVQLQLDSGSGFVDVGAPLNLSPANNGTTDTIAIDTVLTPGTYTIRWMPRNLNGGVDTGTEFFAIDDLIVRGGVLRTVPATSNGSIWMLLLLLLSFGAWRLYADRPQPSR